MRRTFLAAAGLDHTGTAGGRDQSLTPKLDPSFSRRMLKDAMLKEFSVFQSVPAGCQAQSDEIRSRSVL